MSISSTAHVPALPARARCGGKADYSREIIMARAARRISRLY
jgi:hypothetical protein